MVSPCHSRAGFQFRRVARHYAESGHARTNALTPEAELFYFEVFEFDSSRAVMAAVHALSKTLGSPNRRRRFGDPILNHRSQCQGHGVILKCFVG